MHSDSHATSLFHRDTLHAPSAFKNGHMARRAWVGQSGVMCAVTGTSRVGNRFEIVRRAFITRTFVCQTTRYYYSVTVTPVVYSYIIVRAENRYTVLYGYTLTRFIRLLHNTVHRHTVHKYNRRPFSRFAGYRF